MRRDKLDDRKMRSLAKNLSLTFDGGDDRLFFDDDRINVFVNLMTETEWDEHLKALETTIERAAYTVYAWNDSSSYEYWRRQGETGDANYIQITVSVKNVWQVKPDQLKRDIQRLYSELRTWDNTNEYYALKARTK